MLNRTSWIFCSVSLVVGGAACATAFSLSAMPMAAVVTAKAPAPPETLPDIDLGGFGMVSIIDLMGYYIDNPPVPSGGGEGSAAPARRFGGC